MRNKISFKLRNKKEKKIKTCDLRFLGKKQELLNEGKLYKTCEIKTLGE